MLRTLIAAVAIAGSSFPSVSGHDLNGKAVQLPKDFSHEVDLVFVAFAQHQQSDVDSWKSFADDARAKHPDLGVYELPVLSRGISLMRGFIDGGMRKAIVTETARAATVTLYIDKRPFERTLGIENEDQIVVLLVKRDGTILWKANGAYAPGKAATIPRELE